MKTIYKYSLDVVDTQEVILPKWCTPLSVQIQNDKLTMWAMVETDEPQVKAIVTVFGTGHPVPHNFYLGRGNNIYLGTVQTKIGLVWHVFIRGSFTTQS